MLDGQRKVDPHKVVSGVEKVYTFPEGYGPKGGIALLTVRFRAASIANSAFQAGLSELILRRPEVVEMRTNLRRMMDDADFMGLIFDTVILGVNTTLQVGGEAMEPSRENFIALMRYTAEWSDEANEAGIFAPEVAQVTMSMFADIFDYANFYVERKEALQGN